MTGKYQISRGSEWGKWDLHIHTPYSHVSEYLGNNDEEKWNSFFEGLEELPEEIKVIGINDYLFLDGYKRVLKYKKRGNLKNIDLILPVVEFRLKEFVGHESLGKINYHIIFADESLLNIDTIEAQFLSCFRSTCNLDSSNADTVTWGGVVTLKSIEELGKSIYKSTPENKRHSNNLFEIGFNSLSYNLEKVKECLGESKEANTYLKNKYIKAIGKTEWEDFKWTGSPGDKKDIINGSHFVFSASPNVEQANKNTETLHRESVNCRLLHCSDGHSLPKEGSTQTKPKELGHCFTWIKGDSCFETLKQSIVDYENRVLIQERNPADNKNSSPELFIERIEYQLNQEDKILYFNKDINSVIGRRGAGKSVLLKHIVQNIIGVEEYKKDHKKEIKKLNNFNVFWCDNKLEDKFVEYIPQNYLSAITYEDGEKYDERDQRLKELLFNNELFKNADANKVNTVDAVELKINGKIKEALSLQKQIVDATSQLKPLGKTEDKDKAIKLKQEEINKLGKVAITDDDIQNQTKYSSEIESLSKEIKLLDQDIQIIENIRKNEENSFLTVDDEAFFGLSSSTLELIEKHIEKLSNQDVKTYLSTLLIDLRKKIKVKKKSKVEIEKELNPINEKLQQNKTIEKILKEINKLNGDKKEIEELNKSTQDNNEKKEKIIEEISDLYLSFKDKIESIVRTLKDEFSSFTFIKFEFAVSYDVNIYKRRFFDVYIDGRSGERFRKFIDEERDFNKSEIIEIIKEIICDADTAKLKTTGGDKESALIELLSCRYDIDFTKSVKYKEGEESIGFENMTGGQKAMALLDLIFNLSRGGYPIIIDQPENDIDVSGISNDLRKLILDQRDSRQVILATHSPNLLLLTDSENVIVAKNKNNTIKYHNGGIENQQIQDDIVNILEGGKDALKKRMRKLNLKS